MQRMWWFLGVVVLVVVAAAWGGRGIEEEGTEAEDDEAGEMWGVIAAWALAAVGLTAVWNLVRRRYMIAWLKGRRGAIKSVMKWHRKAVMPAHAIGGLVALATGIVHGILMEDLWLLWAAMGVMGFLVVGGALLQWKWTPSKVRKGVYLLHAQQIVFIAMLVMLAAGHALVE